MDENPYQSPEQDNAEPQSVGHRILGKVFWYTCAFFAAFAFLLFSYDQESWGMRIGSGIAVAVGAWAFTAMAQIGYGGAGLQGTDSDDEDRNNHDDDPSGGRLPN